ncbi:hypothetical protein [Lacrimispora saccharolytica]|uniref:hypothetical protein n=1 Tax=Lacrimispora saccharolytica TaxID=84030 RepID=UPI00265CC180|nr:hypothetical protein [Lacrimispora saccharolytica]MCF2655993.1 hypothetical protein [Lacrimispora saccharolytica]
MQEKPTNELEEMLGNMKPGDLSGFYKENSKYLADDKKAFYYYFKDVIEAKNIFLKDVYSFAGVTESWGGKIISMEKHTKNRDLILRLCIAGHFSLEEINRALKLYGMNPLYAKDKRDASIIVAINNRIYDLFQIDEILIGQGFSKLSADE